MVNSDESMKPHGTRTAQKLSIKRNADSVVGINMVDIDVANRANNMAQHDLGQQR
jgi:hypothetical protein